MAAGLKRALPLAVVPVLLLLITAVFSAGSQEMPAPAGTRRPADTEDFVTLLGMGMRDVIAAFGPPVSVYASRGVETWQDDVVFEYPGVDFYIYRDKVWQLYLDEGGGIRKGDPKAAVLLVLGATAQDNGSHIIGPLSHTSWPVEWRFNIDNGKVSAIYLYRRDY
jgi:hypothetical protein